MANLIATEAYAKSIGGKNISYTSNLCCSKYRAVALGCTVEGTYGDRQLVCEKDLFGDEVKYSLINKTSDYLTNVSIVAGDCKFTGNLSPGGRLYSTEVPSGSSWTILINGITPTTQTVYPAPNNSIHVYEYREK